MHTGVWQELNIDGETIQQLKDKLSIKMSRIIQHLQSCTKYSTGKQLHYPFAYLPRVLCIVFLQYTLKYLLQKAFYVVMLKLSIA